MIKAKESEIKSKTHSNEQPNIYALKLRGLPFKIEYCDVEQFLEGFKFIADSIKFGFDESCRKTGEAVILMESEEEAIRALKEKNKNLIQHRYIEIFKVSSNEYTNFELQYSNEKAAQNNNFIREFHHKGK